MPIYEYRCQKCGQTTEVMQKFSDAPLTRCEACGGALEKVISRTSFQLKGGGWYASDYKKPAKTESTGETAKKDTKKGDTP